MQLNLNNTTLFCLDSINIERAIDAVNVCNHYANFNAIKLLSDIPYDYKYLIPSPKINSITEYSSFILKDMNQYIESEYVMICQWDGFILNPDAWTNEFFEYDYIGAPWELNHTLIGNGGFCLRSKRLIEIVSHLIKNMGNVNINVPEDFIICGYLKEILIKKYGIKFAPLELAHKFSVEDKRKWNQNLGFHNFQKVNIFKDGWIKPDIEYLTEVFRNEKVPEKPSIDIHNNKQKVIYG